MISKQPTSLHDISMQTRRKVLMVGKRVSTRNLQEREKRRGEDTLHLSLRALLILRRIPQNLIVSQIQICLYLQTLVPRAMKGGRREKEVQGKISTVGLNGEIRVMRKSEGCMIRDRNTHQEGCKSCTLHLFIAVVVVSAAKDKPIVLLVMLAYVTGNSLFSMDHSFISFVLLGCNNLVGISTIVCWTGCASGLYSLVFCNLSGPQTVLRMKTVIVKMKQVLVMPMLKMEQKRGSPESPVEQVISKTQDFWFSLSQICFCFCLLVCPKLRIKVWVTFSL